MESIGSVTSTDSNLIKETRVPPLLQACSDRSEKVNNIRVLDPLNFGFMKYRNRHLHIQES